MKKFTLIEIMIVVAIIALLSLIVLPNFVQARKRTKRTICIANLKQIEAAKAIWAIQTSQPESAIATSEQIFPFLLAPSLAGVYCPLDKTKKFANSYDLGAISVLATCNFNPGGGDAHSVTGK